MRLPKRNPVLLWRRLMRDAETRKDEGRTEFTHGTALTLQKVEREVREWRREIIRAL